ncbi:DNA-binding response regulator, OmpR family, contains REC and winged-helix (wHTH) domain [Marinobacter sp. DSM 26671]|jgi:DNA-binding response OmpR family regulator|uniref:response regulator transcription factor n=1 Tax=Marinobacter sp. DSM 26671 TaxID=1761793 RepID=UPI0008E860F7|nr:response regulator transcription factor [Marinobacter sp. DSM 26671]SFE37742.1 DNA-binding response regulator, OmpR family, contains REC and winged-helix (wHTH) domain [Marinobacter sp. DSM 26671]
MRVGILEDDNELSQTLALWLQQEGYNVDSEQSVSRFFQLVRKKRPDAVILDWNLPDGSGLEVMSWIRAEYGYDIAVVFSTARLAEEDVVQALRAGADDYLKKPLSRGETLARLQAIKRRISAREDRSSKTFGPYRFDAPRKQLFLGNEQLPLTRKEFDLAYYLFQNHDVLVRRDQVLAAVWGQTGELTTRTIDNHISRLRRKLQTETTGWSLNAVYQQGYRLTSPTD